MNYKVLKCEFSKSGTSQRGKQWTMYKVELEGVPSSVSCFDQVSGTVAGELVPNEFKGKTYYTLKLGKQRQDPSYPQSNGFESRIKALEDFAKYASNRFREMDKQIKPMNVQADLTVSPEPNDEIPF